MIIFFRFDLRKFVGLMALACILVITNRAIVLSASSEAIANAPIEKKLALLDSPEASIEDLNPILVNRFKTLLDMMTKVCEEDRNAIGNWTAMAQSHLKNNGVAESLLNIMEGANMAYVSEFGRIKYKDLVAAYSMLRIKGMGHKEAVTGVHQFLEGFVKMKP
jgi:hypothetical protein